MAFEQFLHAAILEQTGHHTLAAALAVTGTGSRWRGVLPDAAVTNYY